MPKGETTSVETVLDAKLRAWLETATDEVCDVIAEAALPKRRVMFQQRRGESPSPTSIQSGDEVDREALLDELERALREIDGVEKTHVLKAAGAIVVRATAPAVQAIAKHPLVKAIRLNRRIK